MTVRMVQVKHKTTGRKTLLPENALEHFTDYTPTTAQRRRDKAGQATAPGTTTTDAGTPLADTAPAGKKD